MLKRTREDKGEADKRLRALRLYDLLLKHNARLAQALQNADILGHREELAHRRRDLGPNAVDCGDVLLACSHERLERAEVARQHRGHVGTHMPDA